MKFITYVYENKERVGVLSQDGVSVFPAAGVESMLELIRSWPCDLALEEAIPMSAVEKRAPIPRPERDVICLGMNYPKHGAEIADRNRESFVRKEGYAVYFGKAAHYCPGDGEPILSHQGLTSQVDYESELAVILGRDARDLQPEEVPGYIFGYTVLNDVSARDLQQQHKQFYFGKSLDNFCPMGPCIVTADEFEYPPRRIVWSRVNGELRQNALTDEVTFTITDILCELTRGMTLPAGTIIATGTPEGVGLGFEPPRFLQPGDVVECGVEGIGTITNPVL